MRIATLDMLETQVQSKLSVLLISLDEKSLEAILKHESTSLPSLQQLQAAAVAAIQTSPFPSLGEVHVWGVESLKLSQALLKSEQYKISSHTDGSTMATTAREGEEVLLFIKE